MPILIDEVVISIQVDDPSGNGATTPPSDSETNKQIIEECVEQVLEILKQQQEP